jgi:hypothetical protein
MKFKYNPNHAVIQTIKNRQTGASNRFLVCTFDDNGELETNDPKIIHILQTKLIGCKWDSDKTVELNEVKEILDEKELREFAKGQGVKHYWNKNIDNIRKELGMEV